mmetsp:Transcript_38334/g.87081  ORF Transcript_38334/g.87081 Transcript_38334/m.87081 type:complete len:197 (-) Transcript_38334:899-1489(-)
MPRKQPAATSREETSAHQLPGMIRSYEARLSSSKSKGEIITIGLPNGKRARLRIPGDAKAGATISFDAAVPPPTPSVIATAVPNTTDAFEVVVPKKLPEGTNALKAETPYGVAVVVPLPAKATAGKIVCFNASIPAHRRIQCRTAAASKSFTGEYTVVVPAGLRDGDMLRVILPSHEPVIVQLPAGSAGREISFRR